MQGCRHRSVVEIEYRVRFQLTQFGQRRQVVEVFQVEVIEKGLGGGKHRRFAGHVAVADDADPLALHQRLDDLAVDRHAPHILDLAPGDRLAIGDQGNGFEHGPRVALRPLFP
ncbi:hypothetical protein D9M73_266640 [compost metagenome]